VLKITQIKTETGGKQHVSLLHITQHGQHNSRDPAFPVLCFQRPLQYGKVQDIQSLFDGSKHRGFAVNFSSTSRMVIGRKKLTVRLTSSTKNDNNK